jgi:ABC-type dipeptide/oligopeptide/nickel transport system permease subunit
MTMEYASAAVVSPDVGAEPPRSIWRDAWARMTGKRTTLTCLVIVVIYLLVGLFWFLPDVSAKFNPILEKTINATLGDTYESPSLRHGFGGLLGLDIQGRPVVWRLLYGARIALTITVLASIISLGIGVTLGLVAGYFGGWIDELITWLYTTVSSVPWILLVLALVYALKGKKFGAAELPELYVIILALGLTDWVGICRLIRGDVLKHRDRDYVIAAKAMGVGTSRILLRHILPNVFHLVIITFSLGAVSYVQAEVVLTFLGLGISNDPSWGRMIDDAKLELLKGVWWQMVAATVAIGILCLALNVLGDALRDALDPRLRGVE